MLGHVENGRYARCQVHTAETVATGDRHPETLPSCPPPTLPTFFPFEKDRAARKMKRGCQADAGARPVGTFVLSSVLGPGISGGSGYAALTPLSNRKQVSVCLARLWLLDKVRDKVRLLLIYPGRAFRSTPRGTGRALVGNCVGAEEFACWFACWLWNESEVGWL